MAPSQTREPDDGADLWRHERALYQAGYTRVGGADEAGRGPLAGPVVAAVVILPPFRALDGVRDSKVVPEREREVLCQEIRKQALAVGVGACAPRVIDRVNILQATRRALVKAVAGIKPPPDALLTDWLRVQELEIEQRPLVKGDRRSISIAAASLVAKVARDAMMCRLDRRYPGYGFARHKGYATREHLACIARLGITPAHRRSFAPVRAALQGKLDLALAGAGGD